MAAADKKPSICIVSPGTARDNNGNWHTADRWQHMLADDYDVVVRDAWSARDATPDLLIALHARRSCPSLRAFVANTANPSILALTGTDVYHDIHRDEDARRAVHLPTALVVLQSAAIAELPADVHAKTHVIHQSADTLAAPSTREAGLVTMAGHLRAVKDPATFMRAAALVTAPQARLQHIGAALDNDLEALALATQAGEPRYQWLGGLPRDAVRERLRRSHAMAICSTMEGGANVIIEAITSGVPVLASAISGNRGMLGDDYAGYFPVGDAAALARLIDRSIADAAFHATLRAQCAARAPLFAPERERAALRQLVDNLLHPTSTP
ncbi:putative glycosyltransferase (TIGR04348 family) [Pseudoduganella lurida]|uniref:Putative glycosyltransferase (TIGR04348 family) n=1 Tax=Pseudoduganella lurida TaxID=1036180 RepID=A0A562RLR8_9BURK|nr:selenoneine biosynthesis selenosugar synthase SenB [Pseudoduganella lurida]TWI69959.1 putative glycosyltransferase (TIGR04348 family) [Pseudoduganella lurida]